LGIRKRGCEAEKLLCNPLLEIAEASLVRPAVDEANLLSRKIAPKTNPGSTRAYK
jgi:hypothetical protein